MKLTLATRNRIKIGRLVENRELNYRSSQWNVSKPTTNTAHLHKKKIV